jgi:hypothetical protein
MDSQPGNFIHPLSVIETISTEQGDKQVMNTWAFASMIWSTAITDNENALKIAEELFANKQKLEKFLRASKAGNQSMTLTAVNILAFALDEKLDETFNPKQSHNNN